jgi:ribosomal protein L7/L12
MKITIVTDDFELIIHKSTEETKGILAAALKFAPSVPLSPLDQIKAEYRSKAAKYSDKDLGASPKIWAMKEVRSLLGIELKAAKDLVEGWDK